MAHADYNCCAVCDSKLEYAGFDVAATKERICECCLKALRGLGLNVLGVDEFIEWINTTDIATLLKILPQINFRFCYYQNPIDDLLSTRGISGDRKSGDIWGKIKPEEGK